MGGAHPQNTFQNLKIISRVLQVQTFKNNLRFLVEKHLLLVYEHNYAALHTFLFFLLAYLGFNTIKNNLVLVVKVSRVVEAETSVTDYCSFLRIFISYCI